MDMMLSCWVECFTRILVRAPRPRVQAAVAPQRAFNQSVMAVNANAVFDPGAASRRRRSSLAPLFAPRLGAPEEAEQRPDDDAGRPDGAGQALQEDRVITEERRRGGRRQPIVHGLERKAEKPHHLQAEALDGVVSLHEVA